jgi:hypothetical protein
MSFMDRMERRFRRFCIPNLTMIILLGEISLFLLVQINPKFHERTFLTGQLVLDGDVWRLVVFIFQPPDMNLFFFFFACMLFHIMGNALERTWGTFRYNVFWFSGYLATVSVAFIFPQFPMTNMFLSGSVFLAFAMLFPDFTLMMMFILPVKVKWLALLQWVFIGITLLEGNWPVRCIVLAGVFNYFLFFSAEIVRRMKRGKRKMALAASNKANKDEPFHTCNVCGKTDKTDPTVDFRYCSQCRGSLCYCEEHIRVHDHVTDS